MTSASQNISHTLREQMCKVDEVEIFEPFWKENGFSVAAQHTQPDFKPVHDLGLVSIIRIEDCSRLRKSIVDYLSSEAPAGSSPVDFDADECLWQDVFEELDHAKALYDAEGRKSRIRRFLRRGAGLQRNMEPMLEGIPQDSGIGLIRGGLRILLNAVQKRSATCDKIFKVFESVPARIYHAEALEKAHRGVRRLRNATNELYLELFECLPKLIAILLREEDKYRLQNLPRVLGGDSRADVDEILRPFEKAQDRLRECQFQLDSEGIIQIRRLSELSLLQNETTQANCALIREDVSRYHLELIKVSRDWENRLPSVVQRSFFDILSILRQDMKNSLYICVQDSVRTQNLRNSSPLVQLSNHPVDLAEGGIGQALCTASETSAPALDRASILRSYHDFSSEELARANQLFGHARFRGWAVALSSDLVLVNAHCKGETVGSTSAISIFCASLVESFASVGTEAFLPQCPRAILEYYCGHGACRTGTFGNPHGLICSLLDQLLRRIPPEVRPSLPPVSRQRHCATDTHDFSTRELCDIFVAIVERVPFAFPIWCIVDNISKYDTKLHGWAIDLAHIVDCFSRCVHSQHRKGHGGSAPIKFLLTTPEKAVYLADQVPKSDRIDLGSEEWRGSSRTSDIFRSLVRRNYR